LSFDVAVFFYLEDLSFLLNYNQGLMCFLSSKRECGIVRKIWKILIIFLWAEERKMNYNFVFGGSDKMTSEGLLKQSGSGLLTGDERVLKT